MIKNFASVRQVLNGGILNILNQPVHPHLFVESVFRFPSSASHLQLKTKKQDLQIRHIMKYPKSGLRKTLSSLFIKALSTFIIEPLQKCEFFLLSYFLDFLQLFVLENCREM